MSDADRLARAATLFAEALRRPESERDAYLDEACAGDAALRAEVAGLLAADAAPPAWARDEHLAEAAQSRAAEAIDAAAPPKIGGYRILDVLGAGGMGVVYRAEQQAPRRLVALKVIRAGGMTDALRRRFRLEAELLGRLDHPGIARIHEAGVAEIEGVERPFIAMELVAGRPLDAHVRSAGLDRAARLRLFAEICDAVHHAHQRGVIHRDLKPANVLVDAEGRPRVLDFGIARAVGADRAETRATDPGQLIGTLPWMSPEQIGGDPDALDVRSDVWSLGVILHQLLLDRLPHELAGRSLLEAARIVRDERPVSPAALDRSLRGDLDTILRRALEPDRERRYASARDLGEDVRLHLAHRPIVARRDSATYVLARWARRHRAGLAVATVVLVALGLALAARLQDARRTALSVAVNALLIDDEAASDPFRIVAPSIERLDRAARWIDEELEDDPEAAARVHRVVGLGFLKNARLEEAERHLAQAVALRAGTPAEQGADHAAALHDLGRARFALDRRDDATALYERAVALRREHVAASRDGAARRLAEERLADSLNDLAACRKRAGRLEEAERLYREALAMRRALGLDRWVAASVNNLATCLAEQDRWDEAAALFAEALDRLVAIGEANPWFIARTRRHLARCRIEEGRPGEAAAELAAARSAIAALDPADHPEPGLLDLEAARLAFRAGRSDDAERQAEAALARLDATGGSAVERADAHELLAAIASARGDRDRESRHRVAALDLRRVAYGPEHPALRRLLPAPGAGTPEVP